MILNRQSDVKKHLFHRTRSQIHLIPPANQPDSTVSPGVEKVEAPAPPSATPAENPLDYVPKEFEALRNFLISESSENRKSVQD